MCSVNVNFFVVIVVFVICYIPRIYTQILWPCLLSSIFFFFLRGKGKGDKIKAHEMERNKVVICVAFRGFHVEIEWTRVTDQDLMWIEAKTGLQEWVYWDGEGGIKDMLGKRNNLSTVLRRGIRLVYEEVQVNKEPCCSQKWNVVTNSTHLFPWTLGLVERRYILMLLCSFLKGFPMV